MNYSIRDLNEMGRGQFVSVLGTIFEHSPWVAEEVWPERPFESAAKLHEAMMRTVLESPEEAIMALIRAHPDLAARLRVSGYSASEQQGAGLDRLTEEEYGLFSELNRCYTAKFGFPFIAAVAGKTKDDIIGLMRQRIGSDIARERAQALNEISRIAEIRLQRLLSD